MLPFGVDLADWDLPYLRNVLGLHRHVVRLVDDALAHTAEREIRDAPAPRAIRGSRTG